MIPISIILLGVQAGATAYRYGRQMDTLLTQGELEESPFPLPTPTDLVGGPPMPEIDDEIQQIRNDASLPQELRVEADRVLQSGTPEDRIEFARRVNPTLFMNAEFTERLQASELAERISRENGYLSLSGRASGRSVWLRMFRSVCRMPRRVCVASIRPGSRSVLIYS